MYEYEIGNIDALPQGAAETASCSDKPISFLNTGCPGANSERCCFKPIAPTPGPPPPCGIVKVL